jgi:hypothetical protein
MEWLEEGFHFSPDKPHFSGEVEKGPDVVGYERGFAHGH